MQLLCACTHTLYAIVYPDVYASTVSSTSIQESYCTVEYTVQYCTVQLYSKSLSFEPVI
jgi:hypothetical protein